jgi:hypothetical protein
MAHRERRRQKEVSLERDTERGIDRKGGERGRVSFLSLHALLVV